MWQLHYENESHQLNHRNTFLKKKSGLPKFLTPSKEIPFTSIPFFISNLEIILLYKFNLKVFFIAKAHILVMVDRVGNAPTTPPMSREYSTF